MAGQITKGLLAGYDPQGYYCEMTGADGAAPHTRSIRERLAGLAVEDLASAQFLYERALAKDVGGRARF